VNVVAEVERRLELGSELSLAAVGGADSLIAQADDIADSVVFNELVRIVGREWPEVSVATRAARIVDAATLGFARSTRPVCLADAIDALLASQPFAKHVGKGVARTLATRSVGERKDRPLIAAHCLEGALRLALAGYASRHTVLEAFEELTGDEPDLFTRKVARLLGVAFDAWRDSAIVDTLHRLLQVDGSEDEVAFELGVASLSFALDADSADAVGQRLVDARGWFARAERGAEGRTDAIAYGAAVDAVSGFASGSTDAAAMAAKLNAAMLDETWIFGRKRATWLQPRAVATVAWGRLALDLANAGAQLRRESWFEASSTLGQVLQTYRCTRSVHRAGELASIVEPTIEAAFVTRQGLLAHLDDYLGREDAGLDRDTAERLRDRIRLRAGAPPTGKAPRTDTGQQQRPSSVPKP